MWKLLNSYPESAPSQGLLFYRGPWAFIMLSESSTKPFGLTGVGTPPPVVSLGYRPFFLVWSVYPVLGDSLPLTRRIVPSDAIYEIPVKIGIQADGQGVVQHLPSNKP